ncbi:integrase, catalytic region, zinc finger, CCHC-type containing protein [Tanacetum coccineum]
MILALFEKGPLVRLQLLEDNGVNEAKEYVEQALTERRDSIHEQNQTPDVQNTQSVITHNVAYQADASGCIWTQIVMNSISAKCSQGQTLSNGIRCITEYLSETQQETVQKFNSSAQARVLILLSKKEPQAIQLITEARGELADVQKVFYQMEQAVEQHRLESKTFEVKMNQVLGENERLLEPKPFDKDNVTKLIYTLDRKKLELESSDTSDRIVIDTEKRAPPDIQRVRLSTSASGSQPSGNTKNDRILQTPSSNSKNKVEAHPRNFKSSLNKRNGTVKVTGSASVQKSKKQDDSDSVCVNSNDCMSSDNLCVSNSLNDVKSRAKSKKRKSKKDSWKPTGKVFTQIGYIWRPTGRTFTIVGNACPLTRITTTNEVPSRKPIVLDSESPKPVVKLVYSRKPRKNKNAESVSKTKVVQIVLWYLDSGCSKHMTGDRSQLTNFISKFLGTVKFGNDQVAKIMGYGDYQIGNVTISRVYYVEGLGHNLFSVGQFCDSNLEVAFRQHTCFIRNLEGVDLLTGSRGDNLYTLSLGNMMASSPICLLSKASKTKSWLWHRRLSHLNFGAINHLARHGLVRGLPKLKFEKDHLCSACALGKSSKKPHKPKSDLGYGICIKAKVLRNPTNPNLKTPIRKTLPVAYGSIVAMRVASVIGKK